MAYSLTKVTWRATAIGKKNRPTARNIRRRLGGRLQVGSCRRLAELV
jgi:hypothetical protein